MKVSETVKISNPQPRMMEVTFKVVRPGQIFLYCGSYFVKTSERTHFKVGFLGSYPTILLVNGVCVGEDCNGDYCIGAGAEISPDADVTLYPDAVIYLGG